MRATRFRATEGVALCALAWIMTSAQAFAAPRTRNGSAMIRRAAPPTALAFGIPSFLTPKSDDDDEIPKQQEQEQPEVEKKVGWKGLVQLITAGAGAPFLGDFEGVDAETGKFMFSLEANNLVDENGQSKQTAMPYFESGWVDPADEARAAQRKAEGFESCRQ
jgi:hypothetical protein